MCKCVIMGQIIVVLKIWSWFVCQELWPVWFLLQVLHLRRIPFCNFVQSLSSEWKVNTGLGESNSRSLSFQFLYRPCLPSFILWYVNSETLLYLNLTLFFPSFLCTHTQRHSRNVESQILWQKAECYDK